MSERRGEGKMHSGDIRKGPNDSEMLTGHKICSVISVNKPTKGRAFGTKG